MMHSHMNVKKKMTHECSLFLKNCNIPKRNIYFVMSATESEKDENMATLNFSFM